MHTPHMPHIMIFPGVDIFIFELEWSWPNFVVTWLKIFKASDSRKKSSQMVLSQVTGNQLISTRDCLFGAKYARMKGALKSLFIAPVRPRSARWEQVKKYVVEISLSPKTFLDLFIETQISSWKRRVIRTPKA